MSPAMATRRTREMDVLVNRIADATRVLVLDAGYDLADIELVKEGANWYLRFFIERVDPDEAISIDDCEKVSEILSDWLDANDPIPQAYFLEVSSPGIERPLKREKDFLRFRESVVKVSAYAPVHGKKTHIGLLGPVTERELTLTVDGEDLLFDRDKVASVRLHWD